ncbi:nucleoid-structuring protein H-NS [Candidatus Omnitrophus magneticus]|uniref:Nucleoid-structuring protein H-NS n=1 Tax=Candidatus Omnitrophus magneticus TaxID=1609969 RepID=A0A0F0CUI9_9BACT|nr:nucleoid-structuring protein H-NS [Candidatus Omnitrophus magneticus]
MKGVKMYREQIKVLDCTIRDGGLINNHYFEDNFVREVYKAVSDAGVDYMEIGYRSSTSLLSRDKFGKWKFCVEDDIKRAIDGIPSKTKLSVMADVGRFEKDDIPPKNQSVVDMVRVAAYVKDIDKAIDLVNDAAEKGYETTVNVMSVSKVIETELDEALCQLEEESKTKVVYIVDSFGSLYSENIHHLVNKFKRILKTKEVGIHAHNNQQLAYANTIESIIKGANYLDATIYGLGRGAGNCPLELLMGFLKNPKFNLKPILEIIAKEFIPLREKMEWGYIIPYAITGMFNEHPRSAIALRESPQKDEYVSFYEKMLATEMD